MGFWSNLFGSKKRKPRVPRDCRPVRRLANKRGCSVDSLDLEDDSIIEELLLLGLVLSSDGEYYREDYTWTPSVERTFGDTVETVEAVEAVGVVEDTIESTVEVEKPLPPPPPPPPPIYTPPVEPDPTPEPEPERSSWSSEPSSSSWSSSDSFDSGGGGFGDDD